VESLATGARGTLERLGLRDATVSKVETLPTTALGRRLDLGQQRSSLAFAPEMRTSACWFRRCSARRARSASAMAS